jgi:pilus assembly protein CpaD
MIVRHASTATLELVPMTAIPSSSLALKRRLVALAFVAVSGIALVACASKVDVFEKTGAVPGDFRANHPITVDDQIATLDVPVSVDSVHLTSGVKSNIAFFAQQFLQSRTAIIAVVAPSGSPNQVAAASIAVEVEHTLVANGVNPRAISYRVYRAESGEAVAPVRIAFNRLAAQTAPCGLWDDQLASDTQNVNYEALGCATQQNLAAMVQNPLDLLYPRGLTPADAARRATILEKYRNGDSTGAAKPANEGGTAAQGVGN